jgi:hypothetical protein
MIGGVTPLAGHDGLVRKWPPSPQSSSLKGEEVKRSPFPLVACDETFDKLRAFSSPKRLSRGGEGRGEWE